MKCSLEEHTCKFGAERKWRGYPQFNAERFDDKFKGNCDGRTHYSIRVHHTNSERWGMGHRCKIVDQASKACLCLCHDQYRGGEADDGKGLEPTSVTPAQQLVALSPAPVKSSEERSWQNIYDSLVQHAHAQAARVSSSAP
jgi:hypothetical protein